MLLSNVYKHIAFPGWNLKLFLPSKKNGGTDPAKARHHTMTMYINALCFLNNKRYFSGFTTQKNRLTAITAHGNHGDNSESQHGKTLKETVRFAKYPPAMEQSDNCKRHTAGTHQNIAHSQCYHEHVGNCSQPVVSVHGVKSEKISEDRHNIGKSKQNCFSPNQRLLSCGKLKGEFTCHRCFWSISSAKR